VTGRAALVASARLPHYTGSDVVSGTVILAVLFVIVGVIVYLRR
jgi:hypothetical protein